MSFVPDALQRLVSDGDAAFNREDLDSAGGAYLDAYNQLVEFPETPSLHLARAAIAHRLAAVEIIAGNADRADQLAVEVQVETGQAKSVATEELAQQFADDLAETSRTSLQSLRVSYYRYGEEGGPDSWVSSFLEEAGPIQFTAACQHGCLVITTPCGYLSNHC
jgi:hypothetical protein